MSRELKSGMPKFYVVSSELLPDLVEKVLEAQVLLQTGQAHGVSEAVKRVGISRGTFYKYKDIVFSFNEKEFKMRKAILSLVIMDKKGTLSSILSLVAQDDCNVLAINQTIPLNHVSVVALTLDISEQKSEIDKLVQNLKDLDNVRKVELVAIE